MSRNLLIWVVALSVWASSVWAAGPGDGTPDTAAKGKPLQLLERVLGLDEQQVSELKGLLETRQAAIAETQAAVNGLKSELKSVLQDAEADPVVVGGLVLDIRDTALENRAHQAEFLEAFNALLRPGQHARIEQVRKISAATKAAEVMSQLRLLR